MPSSRVAFRMTALRLAVALFANGLGALCAASLAHAQTLHRVNIAVTETSDTHNPYGDSNSLMYGVWCHVYGCLIQYDFDKADYVGLLAQSWETPDAKTWIFHLRTDIRWQNGDLLRADDVLHSFNRVMTDPNSKQKQNLSMVAKMEAIDDHTVKVTTKEPTAPLLSYLTQFIITNKSVFDKYGAKAADEQHPVGAAEYKLERLVPGQMFAIVKNPDFPGMRDRPDAPDRIVFQIVREPEVRAVGLFNGEFQIAQRLIPDLIPQVEKNPNTKVVSVPAAEFMFLGMTPKRQPWNNKLVRQAVCYAIDRDAIIKNILRGQATRLDGVVGPGQYGYDPNTKERYPFDPQKAKAFARAGRLSERRRCRFLHVDRPLPVRQDDRGRHCADAAGGRHQGDTPHAGSIDVLGGHSAWSSAVLLLGPPIGHRSEPRLVTVFRNWWLTAHRDSQLEHRPLAALGAGDFRSSGAQEGFEQGVRCDP